MNEDHLKTTEVVISQDGLKAFLTVYAEDEEFPSVSDVYNILEQNGVVYGLLKDLIHQIAIEKIKVTKMCVAKGIPPQPERNSLLSWHVSLTDNQKPAIDEKNRADFKKLRGYTFVLQGQKILTAKESEATVDGKSVTGEAIKFQEWQPDLLAGENTILSHNGRTLVSKINGVATWQEGKVRVEEVYHIQGNVDYHTGNVKYKGPIVIDGDVRSGFRVESTESIFIGGTVGASYIYSQSGDITVTFGILGKGRAKLLAGGSLRCGFVQDATVSVKENVIIDHYAINSIVSAGQRVILTKNEGLIRGGSVTAEAGIDVQNVGSTRNLYTELKLRSHGEQSVQKMLWELNRNRSELDQHHLSLTQRLSFLSILKKSKSLLSEDKEIEIKRLNEEIREVTQKIIQMDQEELDLQKKVSSESVSREIKIYNQMYINVRIDITGLEYYVDNPVKQVRVFRFKDNIVIEPLADFEDSENDIFVPMT